MRNEVWVMDIAAKVREDIDDPLAQDLVIGVCLFINITCFGEFSRCYHHFSVTYQLLELDPEQRLNLRDLTQHPYFART